MPLLRCLFMMLQARRNDGRLAPRSVAQQRACLVENILHLFGRASGLPHATMAKGAQKRIASTNARAVQTLALGFAITIMVIGKKSLLPWFIGGFFAVLYLKVDIMAMAIFGTCVAFLIKGLAKNEGAA